MADDGSKRKRSILAPIGAALGAAALAVPVVCVLALSGCARLTGNYVNSPKNRRAAIKYLNEKYNTRFTYLEDKPYKLGSGDVFGRHGNTVHMYVTCEELPDKKIFVAGNEGSDTFYCNYTAVKYGEATREIITEISRAVYGDSTKVYWEGNDGDLVGCMDKDASLEDYLAGGDVNYFAVFTTKNDDMTGDYERLIYALIDRGVDCKPQSYHFTEDVYSSHDNTDFTYEIPKEKKCGRCFLHFTESILAEGYVPDYVFADTFI